jgi:hypothetical protein
MRQLPFEVSVRTPPLTFFIHVPLTLLLRPVNFIEYPAVGKMGLLSFLPTSKDFVDGKQAYFGKLTGILAQSRFRTWTVKMFAGNILAFI